MTKSITKADVISQLAAIKDSGLSEHTRGVKCAQVCKSVLAYAILKENRQLLQFILDEFDILGSKQLRYLMVYGGYDTIDKAIALFEKSAV